MFSILSLEGCAPTLQEPPYEVTEASTYWPIPLLDASIPHPDMTPHYPAPKAVYRSPSAGDGCYPAPQCGAWSACPWTTQRCVAGCCLETP